MKYVAGPMLTLNEMVKSKLWRVVSGQESLKYLFNH